MENALLSILSVILFCACCHQFIKTVVTPIPLLATERRYARAAMQLGKFYKSIAWGTMTATFLIGLVFSFQQVFTQI
ncbi:hypothetical protein QJS83_10835 [Bdellovibrio sp. 22V]|uniref:hypothetical protein n=1 Tax=Bdellovibrio TaxID=958 RepID=UPI0025436434|nr:hypothetical protein [Bdellovibrio sp. 22V]WII70956.1 hypothetical protein QJS83_10835 [Bdellovibrio sp. 22V]